MLVLKTFAIIVIMLPVIIGLVTGTIVGWIIRRRAYYEEPRRIIVTEEIICPRCQCYHKRIEL